MAHTRPFSGRARCSKCKLAATVLLIERPGDPGIPCCGFHGEYEARRLERGETPTPNCIAPTPKPLGRLTGAERNG
jgi:hypothetical protein